MADEADDELLLTDEVQSDEPEQDNPDKQDDEETVVTFGDDEAAEPEGTDLVKHLRQVAREQAKELAELRKSVKPAPAIEIGEKPTLAACDYDEDEYETQLDAWKDRKAQVERQETEQQAQARQANEAWQADLGRFQEGKAKLALPDYDEVEEAVTATLNQVQQAVIVKAADDPALLLYSLGKHPAKLAELKAIADPLKLAAAVAKLEGTLKMTKRRKGPDVEQVERGNAAVVAGSDKKLERLTKEAEKTGNRTPLINYKRELANRGK